jgi:hypothetical protein
VPRRPPNPTPAGLRGDQPGGLAPNGAANPDTEQQVAVGVAAGCWFGWSVWNVLPTILRGAATWDTSSLAMAALPLALATLVGAILPAVSALRDTPGHLIASPG